MTELNPNDFIITRKRKKYRFALFHNASLCFELDEWDKTWQPDVVEIGAGNGLFSVSLAERYPSRKFVAIDVKADRLQKGAQIATERELTNVRFLRARADQLTDVMKARTLEAIWLTFPDPFPKKRSAGRRMTHATYLQIYAMLLKPAGAFYLKHDDRDFFCWSLEQLVSNKWHIDELSFDLHESKLSEEYKIMTTYETRWTNEGIVTNFLKASSLLR